MDPGVVSAAAALVGVIVGAVLGPWVSSRIARRDHTRAQFDDAIAKVKVVQALRHYPTAVPPSYLDPEGVALAEVTQFNRRQREAAVTDFYEAMRDARSALALVQGSDPEIQGALSKWEITESGAQRLVSILERSRRDTLRFRT